MKEALTLQHHQVPQTLLISETSGSLHIVQPYSHGLRYGKEPVLQSVVLHESRSIFHPNTLKRGLNLKQDGGWKEIRQLLRQMFCLNILRLQLQIGVTHKYF